MEAKQVKDLMEAYSSVYQGNEEVSEDLQQKVGQALDAAAKNPVIKAIGNVIAPVGQGRKTPTKDGNWRPVVAKEETEEVEHLDEITRSMGRRADEYNKKKAQAAHMERVRQHQHNMENNPEYRERHERLRQTHSRREDQKESFDLFDYLLEYLVAEGYADTNKAALAIMANMSEEWKQSIMEASKLLTQPTDKTARPTQQRQSGPATGPGSEARPQQTRRQLMTSPQKPQIDKTARPTQQSGPAPQSSGGLTPMQRLQRRPDITIR